VFVRAAASFAIHLPSSIPRAARNVKLVASMRVTLRTSANEFAHVRQAPKFRRAREACEDSGSRPDSDDEIGMRGDDILCILAISDSFNLVHDRGDDGMAISGEKGKCCDTFARQKW